MSDTGNERDSPMIATTLHFDPEGRLSWVEMPTPPGASWEHDEAKRVFRVTDPDVTVTEFHDRPVRFLVVEQDPRTDKLVPVISPANDILSSDGG